MEKHIGKFSPFAFAILRIVSGLMFATHGMQKLFGFPGDKDPMEIMSLMGMAGIIEFVGGLLIAFGLFGSIAAFIASGEMAVAFFMVHFPQGWIPLLNGGEHTLLYCFVFLYIASRGSGIWSIDALKGNAKANPV